MAATSHFAPEEGLDGMKVGGHLLQSKLIVNLGFSASQEAGLNKPRFCRDYPKDCKADLALNRSNLTGDLEGNRI